MKSRRLSHVVAAVLLCCGAAQAQAQVTVQDAWVRGTVPAQEVTGAFLSVTTPTAARLVAVRTPVAGRVEIHEMAHEDGVMKMRALPTGLPLPAGQAVELKPGGYHLMLMELKQPVKAGEPVPLTLVVEGEGGRREEVAVKAEVKALGAQAPSAAPMQHEHGHSHKP
jgi:copper(I)-binding protein